MVLYHFKVVLEILTIYLCKWWNHVCGRYLTEDGKDFLVYLYNTSGEENHIPKESEKVFEELIQAEMQKHHCGRTQIIEALIDQMIKL